MPKMNPTTKKGLTVAIILATVGVSGLAIRYFYKKWKTKKEEADALLIAQLAETSSPSSSSPTSSSGSGSVSGSGNLTLAQCRKKNPFSTKEEVIAFQKWVISKYGNILGKSGADGDFGCLTLGAWENYGSSYASNSNPGAPTGNQYAIKQAKKKIIKFFKGDKEWIKQKLGYHTDGFILEWAKNVDKFNNNDGAYGSAFVYANQVYIVHDGSRVLTTNPIDRDVVKAKTSIMLRSMPSKTPDSYQTFSMPNVPIGKVVNVYWNNSEKRLYFLTNRSNYIWVLSSDVKYA